MVVQSRIRRPWRRLMAALGGLLALAVVLGALGLVSPSLGHAATVSGSEPYTIDLKYSDYASHPNGASCNGDICSAHLLVNTANYPKHDGALTVVLRGPKAYVGSITATNIGGMPTGSAAPLPTSGSETINGVDYTTATITWATFTASTTTELDIPVTVHLKNDLPNGTRFSVSAEATPGTQAQADNPPALSFFVQYSQSATLVVSNMGHSEMGSTTANTTVIGSMSSDPNGYLPTDADDLKPTSLSLQVPSLVADSGVRTAESATVTYKLPAYATETGQRTPLVDASENAGWTVSADGTTVTRTFTVPAGTADNQRNAALRSEIEAAKLVLRFPGAKSVSATTAITGAISTTISYAPHDPAAGEQPVTATTGARLAVTSIDKNGVGSVGKVTNQNGLWQSSQLSDTEGNRAADFPWQLRYVNTSGLPIEHLVLTDTLPAGETALKLVGFKDLSLHHYNFSNKSCPVYGTTLVGDMEKVCDPDVTSLSKIKEIRAYTSATDYDTYSGSQLTMSSTGISARFDSSKTYIRFDIVFADSYAAPYQAHVSLTPLTQFRDVKDPAYKEPTGGDDSVNDHHNTALASGQFSVDGKTVAAITSTVAKDSVPYVRVTKFSEWLDLQAPNNFYGGLYGNRPLATIGGSYKHTIILSANIDETKDWSSAKLIILLPSSFTPNSVADLDKDQDNVTCRSGVGAYSGQNFDQLSKGVSYYHDYQKTGRNAVVVTLSPEALKAMQTPSRTDGARKQAWIYLDGTINGNALEGNTGTFTEYFTADSAPAQTDAGTVPDVYHFGPNANIVSSSFTYTLVNPSNSGALFIDKRVSAFRDGNASNEIGISAGQEFYYRILMINTHAYDSGQVTFMDGLPTVGDKTPQTGEDRVMGSRRTQFPVRLSGPLAATDPIANLGTAISPAPVAGTTVTFNNLTPGYYLIVDSADQSKPVIISSTINGATKLGTGANAQTLGSGEVKSAGGIQTNPEKKMTATNHGTGADAKLGSTTSDGSVTVGDTYGFELSFNVPNSKSYATFTATDTPTNMSIDPASVKVKIGDAAAAPVTGLTAATADAAGNPVTINGLKFSIGQDGALTVVPDPNVTATTGKDGLPFYEKPSDFVAANSGKRVVITYNATITKADASNQFELNLDPLHGNPVTPPPTVIKTHSYAVTLHKIGAADRAQGKNAPGLQGAEFTLQNTDTNKYYSWDADASQWKLSDTATPMATDTTGNLTFTGLGSGNYQIVETKAPQGYSQATLPTATLTIAQDSTNPANASVKVQGTGLNGGLVDTLNGTYTAAQGETTSAVVPVAVIANINSLTQLPQTGGAGIIAIALLLAVLLIAGVGIGFAARKVNERRLAVSKN